MNESEHILICIAEECAEIQKAVSKALRFGLDDRHPNSNQTNKDDLAFEIADLLGAIEMAQDYGIIPDHGEEKIRSHMQAKKENILKFMNYAETGGTLTRQHSV